MRQAVYILGAKRPLRTQIPQRFRSGSWSGIRESNPPILLGKQVFYQ